MATVDLLQHWLTFNREVTANRTVQEQLSYKILVVEGQTLIPSIQLRWRDTNLIPNAGFEDGPTAGPWNVPLANPNQAVVDIDDSPTGPGKVLQHNSGGIIIDTQSRLTAQHENVGWWNTYPGEEFYLEAMMRKVTAGITGESSLGTTIYKAGGTSPTWPVISGGMAGLPQGQWTKTSGLVVMPTDYVYISLRPSTRNSVPAGETIQFDDLYMSYGISETQPIALRVLAFDAIGNQVSDTLIAAHSNATGKPETDWTTLGGSPYVVPTGATSVRVKVVVTADAKVGTIEFERPKLEMAATPPNSAGAGYGDRWRFVVEQARTGEILTRDLVAQEVQVVRSLSGPSQIEFKIHPNEPSVQMADGSGPIQFKAYGHIIHAIKEDQFGDEIVWASCIVQPSDVDPTTGIMSLRATGFSSYPKGLPWLENWNPIAVDPFEIVERIWTHIQSFPNGNLGVTVYPTVSGTQMLPGFSFNNEEFIQDFFAIFIRESDRQDCGDYINKLARDIPFDFFEESAWNTGRTAIEKKIRLAYPAGGVDQVGLSFRVNENIREATPKQEVETSWFSDISLKGYFPGKEYSVQLANADPDRLRRVMNELDLNINSQERGAAWAKRALTRRQFPRYFESVVIDPYHSNAPFGTFDVGDLIQVQGPMAWVGSLNQKHKITMIAWDETKNLVQLQLLAEGAFNYDPIEYIP